MEISREYSLASFRVKAFITHTVRIGNLFWFVSSKSLALWLAWVLVKLSVLLHFIPDLPDGGAAHFAETVTQIKKR